jgi:hypothetical protein
MSSLKQVSYLLISPVVILAVSGKHTVHDPTDRVCLSFDQQMNMVGHQTISIEEEGQQRLLCSQQ